MPIYLTPARYRSMGQGVDLTDVEDQDLAAQIMVASGLVNVHCNVDFDYDFRGGTVTGEEQSWKIGNYMWPASQKVYPDKPPLITLSSFRIYVSNTQYLDVSPSYVHYDKGTNCLQPVIASASIGVWSYEAVPIVGYQDPHVLLSYTYGHRFSVTNEQMFPDGGVRWRAQNQWWDSTVEPVVKVNGATLALASLTINYDEGTVGIDDDALTDLDISVAEVDNVTATYTHKLPTNVMTATAMITTTLLGNRAINEKGLQGLSGIRVEEVEIRQSRDSQLARDTVPGNAQLLLAPYRRFHWGA